MQCADDPRIGCGGKARGNIGVGSGDELLFGKRLKNQTIHCGFSMKHMFQYQFSMKHIWLPVQQRVTYKIGLLVYKTLQSEKPAYLHSLLIPYEPARCLRSKEHSLLTKGHFNTKAASRAFRHSAPEIWNRLNLNTRCAASLGTFKKLLKTELFTSVFRV